MLLDTSCVIDLMRERSRQEQGPASRKLTDMGDQPVRLPLFALCELLSGAASSQHPARERERLDRLVGIMEVVYPGQEFASVYGHNEAMLRQTGQPIPLMDLLIASLALQNREALVTRDREHFSRVQGLAIETY